MLAGGLGFGRILFSGTLALRYIQPFFRFFQPNLRVLVSGGGVYLKIPPFLVTGVELSGP